MGASGVGKDALMQYARRSIDGSRSIVFAHRYITRPFEAGGENHIYLSPGEFALRKGRNLFALDWESHGFCYGIGREIDAWMADGLDVVVNGSREYLPIARERYPHLVAVLIEADPAVVRQRLEGRGRETQEEVERRLRRAPVTTNTLCIQNDSTLEEGGNALLSTLFTHHQSSRT